MYANDIAETRAVFKITSNTSLQVTSVWGSTDASTSWKIGTEVTIVDRWYYVWVATDGTNTIGFLSTQRTTPFLAGITGKRLLGAVLNDSGDITQFSCRTNGRYIEFTDNSITAYLNGGTATSFTRLGRPDDTVPHIAQWVNVTGVVVVANTEANGVQRYMEWSADGVRVNAEAGTGEVDNAEHGVRCDSTSWVQVQDGGALYYLVSGTGTTGYLYSRAWAFER